MAFQVSKTGLTTFLAQLVFILKVVIESKHRGNVLDTSSQNVHFWGCEIFLSPSGWLFNQLNFSVVVHIYKTHDFDELFFLLTIYGIQIFQCGDMLWEALTKKHAWHLNGVVLWGHVTNKWQISTCRSVPASY